jgi:hypothetical protein
VPGTKFKFHSGKVSSTEATGVLKKKIPGKGQGIRWLFF